MRLPAGIRLFADLVPPARIGAFQAAFLLLEDANDLLLTEPALAHRGSPFRFLPWRTPVFAWSRVREQVTRTTTQLCNIPSDVGTQNQLELAKK